MPTLDQRPIVLSLDLDQAVRLVRTLRQSLPDPGGSPPVMTIERSLADYVEARCAATFGSGFLTRLSQEDEE